MREIGSERPDAVELFRDIAGRQYARLRKNIEEDWRDVPEDSGAEPQQFFTWDELVFPTDLGEEEIGERFDELWYEAERRQMPEDEWRQDVDSTMLDLMELVVG